MKSKIWTIKIVSLLFWLLNKGGKGLILVQTEKFVLMGIYNENMFPSICVEAIEKLGLYYF